MKRLFNFAFIFFLIGWSTTDGGAQGLTVLNGSWTPVKQEIGGMNLPAIAFQAQKLIISDSNYIFTAESADKGTLNIKGSQMDIYGKEGVNTGKHFTAIYKLEGNQLTICYNLKGDSYPSDFETKSNPMLFLSVFKKDQSR